ncbi:hypothetical protein JCM6882_005440 [Rhodosporidiobolus microsporus]
MVCAKCEKKLAKSSGSQVAAVDMWKSASERGASRKIGENKLLSSKSRYSPYAPGGSKAGGSSSSAGASGSKGGGLSTPAVGKCTTCKVTVAREGNKYCQGCAYKGGVCAMCGKQILDTRGYKMSSK